MNNKTLQDTNCKLEQIEYKMTLLDSLAFVLHTAAATNIYSSGEFAGALNILLKNINEIHGDIIEINESLEAGLDGNASAKTANSAQN